jgi:phosphohistidine phosphatase
VELTLVRHGVAEDAGPRTGGRDEPRELTADGAARMRRAAQGMAALGMMPEVLLTSPLPRCRQTAEIIREALGGDLVPDDRLAPGMDLGDLADVLEEHPGIERVVVCGHQPDLAEVAAALVGGGRIEFKKGAVAVLELNAARPAGGYLRALHPPAALRRLADAGP